MFFKYIPVLPDSRQIKFFSSVMSTKSVPVLWQLCPILWMNAVFYCQVLSTCVTWIRILWEWSSLQDCQAVEPTCLWSSPFQLFQSQPPRLPTSCRSRTKARKFNYRCLEAGLLNIKLGPCHNVAGNFFPTRNAECFFLIFFYDKEKHQWMKTKQQVQTNTPEPVYPIEVVSESRTLPQSGTRVYLKVVLT